MADDPTLELRAPSRRRTLGYRAGWTLADQVLSSATNFGLSFVVVRAVDVSTFGAFSLAFVAFTFVIGVSRALLSDPLVIRFSTAGRAGVRKAARQATGAALVLGLAGSLVCLVAAWMSSGALSTALVALAVGLPGLLVQDVWRFAFFAEGCPSAATANDLAWATVQFSAFGVLIAHGAAGVLPFMLAWGGAALVGAVLGAAQMRAVPQPQMALRWLRSQRDIGSRMGADYVINMGAFNLATFLVGAIAGLGAVAALRAAQLLLGPLQLIYSGLASFVLPLLARRAAQGGHLLWRPAVAISGAAGGIAASWLAVALLLPRSIGVEVLGASWDPAREVMLFSGLVMVAVGCATGPMLCVKGLGRPALLLRVTLVQAPLNLAFGSLGAALGGALLAAVGFAVAHAMGASLTWYALRVASRGQAIAPAAELSTDNLSGDSRGRRG